MGISIIGFCTLYLFRNTVILILIFILNTYQQTQNLYNVQELHIHNTPNQDSVTQGCVLSHISFNLYTSIIPQAQAPAQVSLYADDIARISIHTNTKYPRHDTTIPKQSAHMDKNLNLNHTQKLHILQPERNHPGHL